MTPDDIIKLLDATCICGARKLHDPIQHAFAADLMSDVLRLNTEGLLLITGMANPQVIRTAEMADIPFILFVRDKQITAEMHQLAEENEILLLRCRQSMFRVCGELYKAGLLPVYYENIWNSILIWKEEIFHGQGPLPVR